MNENSFVFLMNAVDCDLLEEAWSPAIRPRSRLPVFGAAAACAGVLITSYLWIYRGRTEAWTVKPVRHETVTEMGNRQLSDLLPVPDEAQEISYTVGDGTDPDDAPMAEVSFECGGHSYLCRTMKVSQSVNLSGIYENEIQSLNWTIGTLEMQMHQSEKDGVSVGWYDTECGIQWCLSGDGDVQSLLHTAQIITEKLGYEIAVAPAGAEEVSYNVFELDGLVVGETRFILDGAVWSYRMAQTWETEKEFADISGIEDGFQEQTTGEILWCPARLYFDEGGAGKVVWFDVVPGLLYSLSVEQGASAETILDMANQLFEPAQGETG